MNDNRQRFALATFNKKIQQKTLVYGGFFCFYRYIGSF